MFENVLWLLCNVVFVMLYVSGSNNGCNVGKECLCGVWFKCDKIEVLVVDV